MSEDANSTIMRLQANIENLQKDLRAMRIGREHDDLQWRKLWEQEKRRAEGSWNAAIQACAEMFDEHETYQWLCLDHGDEEVRKIQKMIRKLASPPIGWLT